MTGTPDKSSPNRFGKVAVMLGGSSGEREISLQSGEAVYKAMLNKGIDAELFDPAERSLTELLNAGFDRVFIALHGKGGEDGLMQGALETLNIPYTGTGVLGSALAMDKSRSKQIWLSQGLPTPDYVELNESSDWQAVADKLGLPIMVKPAREGSSLGASKVESVNDLPAAYAKASSIDETIIAETWIEGGGEYTVPILNGRALRMIKLVTPNEFYDYEAKYLSDTTEYLCPCGLSDEHEKTVADLSLQAFSQLACSGWGRVDVLLDHDLKPWLIEVNTVPGMTSHSLVPMSAKQSGISFDELVVKILETSFETSGMTVS